MSSRGLPTQIEDVGTKIIEELTAQFFWRYVRDVGMNQTIGDVTRTRGAAILNIDDATDCFDALDEESLIAVNHFMQVNEDAVRLLRISIAGQAFDCVMRHVNPQGEFFMEDIATGRSPSVASVVREEFFATLAAKPRVLKQEDVVNTVGKLILRSPLPAVVHSPITIDLASPFIRIKDTSALGDAAEVPLYMYVKGVTQAQDGGWFLSGLVVIPVPTEQVGERWVRVIPNAMCTMDAMLVETKMGNQVGFTVEW